MGALILALLPILEGLFAGTAVPTILGALTLAQWGSLAAAIANLAAPAIEDVLKPEVSKGIAGLHPILAQLIDDIEKFGPQTAAEKAKDNAERIAFGFEDPKTPGVFG